MWSWRDLWRSRLHLKTSVNWHWLPQKYMDFSNWLIHPPFTSHKSHLTTFCKTKAGPSRHPIICNKQSHYLGRNRCRPSSLSLSDEFILQAGNFSYQQNKLQGLCSRVPEMLWQSLECKWVSRRVPRYLESPPDLSSLLMVLKGGDELARCKGRKEILCLLKWGEVFFSHVGYHFIKYQYL